MAKIAKLDELTQIYVHDGPLNALKAQTRHLDFICAHLLSN